VSSTRGTGGGFTLVKDPNEITLLDVLEAIEGQIALNVCLLNGNSCENRPICAVHEVWREAQDSLIELLKRRSFAELAEANRLKSEAAAREPQASD